MKPFNMKMYTFLAILSIVVAQILCAELPMETAPGRCPKPTTVTNFQPEKFQGVWYDIKRYKNTILKGSCGTQTFTWDNDDKVFTAPYQMYEYPTNNIKLRGKNIPRGIFRTNVNGLPTPFDSWILDTDYENYQVTYTCIELVPFVLNSQSINIYSRNTTLDAQYLDAVLENLTKNKLDVSILRDVQQDDTYCGRN